MPTTTSFAWRSAFPSRASGGSLASRPPRTRGRRRSTPTRSSSTSRRRSSAPTGASGGGRWRVWRGDEGLAIYERQRVLTERFAKTAEQRYAVGGVPQADVLRAQVELTHAITEVQSGSLAIDTARAGLNARLGRPPSDPLGDPEEPRLPKPPPSADALIEAALARRPELSAQDATIAGQRHAVALARKAYWPDFEVSVGRFVNFDARDGFGAMASVTVPIANKGKYDAAVSQANARVDAAEADRRRIADAVRRDVEQAWLRVRTATLRHGLFVTTHLPQAEQAIQVTESAYAAGTVDLLALLDTLRGLEQVHLDHVDSAAEIEGAWADLERAVGGALPELGAEEEGRPHGYAHPAGSGPGRGCRGCRGALRPPPPCG